MISFVCMIVSIFGQVILTNQLAVKGIQLSHLEAKKTQIEKEIAVIEYEDSTLSSMKLVESKAKELGFVKYTEALLAVKAPTSASLYTN